MLYASIVTDSDSHQISLRCSRPSRDARCLSTTPLSHRLNYSRCVSYQKGWCRRGAGERPRGARPTMGISSCLSSCTRGSAGLVCC